MNGFGDDDSISVSSGSLPEGLDVKGSDEDKMLILKFIDVVPPDMTVRQKADFTYLTMNMDKTRPGYANLELSSNDCDNAYIKKALLEAGNQRLISSSKFRGIFIRPGMGEHGPCLSDGVFDFAISLHGTEWPTIAKERILNSKSKRWLTDRVAEDLISDGCVYVPVGPRNSIDYSILWRISFAMAERKLVQSMTHAQILCYALMKIVLKEWIDKHEATKDLLCSYFMKTCLFWLIEETDNDENTWSATNLLHCFDLCLDKILCWVDQCNCPNYFIPENNMFVGKIHDKNKEPLLSVIKTIKQEGYKSLLKCESLGSFLTSSAQISAAEREANLDLFCYRVMHIYPFDSMDLLCSALDTLNELSKKVSHNLVQGVITKLQGSLHREFAQMLRVNADDKASAETRYRQKVHLLEACRADACSGFILLAAFYHVQGRHYTALEILKTVSQKFNPRLIQARQAHYSEEEKKQYMTSFCGRGFSLEHKMKTVLISDIVLLDNSSIVPNEFGPELNHCRPLFMMPPFVYACAIEFLCFHHLNDRPNTVNTLRKLEKVVMTKYFVLDRFFSNGFTVLGACYETDGDKENAKRCYLMALDNPRDCLQSLTYRLDRLEK